MNIVGKRVQDARNQFTPCLTQAELASRLKRNGWKISRGTLAKIESGVRQVTDIEVMYLAQTLRVSTFELLDKRVFKRLMKIE